MQPIDRKFEKFLAGQNKPWQERFYVSISHRSRIAMNDNCYRQLGKPPAVYLYYSRIDDMIAVEPVQSLRLPCTFEVKRNGASGWRVNASPFCSHHNIKPDTTERFITPEFEGGRLYLRLGQTVTVHKRSNKRAPG